MTAVTVITMSRDELANIISEAVQSGIERATQKTGERWGVADLARHYRVCEATIRNRRKAGMLPPMSGDAWLRADVLRWDRERGFSTDN